MKILRHALVLLVLRHAHDVGTGTALEIDGLDVLVDDRHLMFRGGEGGQERQAGDSNYVISITSNTLRPGDEKPVAQRLKEILKPAFERARGA